MNAILLSMELNPSEPQPEWLNDFELGQRCSIAISHVRAGILKVRRPPLPTVGNMRILTWQALHDAMTRQPEDCLVDLVSLPAFALWAKSLEWEIPSELVEIAEKPPLWRRGVQAIKGIFNSNASKPSQPPDSKKSGIKVDKQCQAILRAIQQKQWDPQNVPDGEKDLIKTLVEQDDPEELFKASSAFLNAWKEGLRRGMWRMRSHDSYARRGN
ncbi:MAG: hypothetical protein WCP34_12990 [Pseudomonadota bacterium]